MPFFQMMNALISISRKAMKWVVAVPNKLMVFGPLSPIICVLGPLGIAGFPEGLRFRTSGLAREV